MIIEWGFYLEAQVLNGKEFSKKSTKTRKRYLYIMMEGWR